MPEANWTSHLAVVRSFLHISWTLCCLHPRSLHCFNKSLDIPEHFLRPPLSVGRSASLSASLFRTCRQRTPARAPLSLRPFLFIYRHDFCKRRERAGESVSAAGSGRISDELLRSGVHYRLFSARVLLLSLQHLLNSEPAVCGGENSFLQDSRNIRHSLISIW